MLKFLCVIVRPLLRGRVSVMLKGELWKQSPPRRASLLVCIGLRPLRRSHLVSARCLHVPVMLDVEHVTACKSKTFMIGCSFSRYVLEWLYTS